MSSKAATLVWFRRDLRLRDNPALAAALAEGGTVIPVYVHDEGDGGDREPGGASRWWLARSLEALSASLRGHGSRLVIARGRTVPELMRLARETGASRLHWNRVHEPAAQSLERSVLMEFAHTGVATRAFNAALLFEPESVSNQAGNPFQVFTPFWRHCLALPAEEPGPPPPARLPAPERWPAGREPRDLGLLAGHPWEAKLARLWTPGEDAALGRLYKFAADAAAHYAEARDRPAVEGTSLLSPHLHFGEIGPRQVRAALGAARGKGRETFLAELGWREFAHHLLHHFPSTPSTPLRREFDAFPWREDAGLLRAWQRGRTGYPIVDAGMRQLWATGWMHNRVRMIAASFLVKDLLLSWRSGAAWFWDTLVDADLASNTLGWQWSAGCGADAAPYFRIFNPVLQGRKFDPDGAYVRRWVPELASVPAEFVHEPWAAPPLVLAEAGVVLGNSYPHPVVDHAKARRAALAALETLRREKPAQH
jgi:deoxyribodipyrimidine photo-lyase